jgi:hypothetical protein
MSRRRPCLPCLSPETTRQVSAGYGAQHVCRERNGTREIRLRRPGQGTAPRISRWRNRVVRSGSPDGVVVLLITATNNAVGEKGLCFGRGRKEGTCQGMAGTTGPNHPATRLPGVNAQQPRHELWGSAKRRSVGSIQLRVDHRGTVCGFRRSGVHADSGRPSVSRVREIVHGLKGGPALSPMTITE